MPLPDCRFPDYAGRSWKAREKAAEGNDDEEMIIHKKIARKKID